MAIQTHIENVKAQKQVESCFIILTLVTVNHFHCNINLFRLASTDGYNKEYIFYHLPTITRDTV